MGFSFIAYVHITFPISVWYLCIQLITYKHIYIWRCFEVVSSHAYDVTKCFINSGQLKAGLKFVFTTRCHHTKKKVLRPLIKDIKSK